MDFYSAIHSQLSEIAVYAKSQFPKESCGFVTDDGFKPVENSADDPYLNFVIDGRTFDDNRLTYYEKRILGIFHSHTNGVTSPSQADLTSCEQLGIPWAVYTLPQEHLELFEPSGYKAPLVGRQWHYGVLDCYSIIRDTYQQLGIILSDFVRAPLFSWNTDPNWNQYEDNFIQEGFYKVQNRSAMI